MRLRAVALALAGNADPARRSRSGTPVALHNGRWLPGIAPEPPDGRAPLRGEVHRRPSRSGRSVAGVMRARRWGRRLYRRFGGRGARSLQPGREPARFSSPGDEAVTTPPDEAALLLP